MAKVHQLRKSKSRSSKKHNRKSNKRTQRGAGCGRGCCPMCGKCGGCMCGNDWRKIDNMTNVGGQKGGSPQSDLVMDNSMKAGVLNDYINSPRIRQAGYDDGFANPMCQGGGSSGSNMVAANMTADAMTKTYPEESKVVGNMNSLNLYQTTGGSRKHRSRNNERKTERKNNSKRNNGKRADKKRSRRNNKRQQRGGASDWIMSNYSQGNINAPAQPLSWTGQFGVSQPSARDMLMNPPTLGLAGSGYPMGSLEGANVRMTGAPVS